jgi:exodeoxyribonuclease VII small subunit
MSLRSRPVPGSQPASSGLTAEPDSLPALPATFEAALAELESLVTRMETTDLPLEASLAAYQRGAQLKQFCEEKLKDAEQRIFVLEGDVRQPYVPDGRSTPND